EPTETRAVIARPGTDRQVSDAIPRMRRSPVDWLTFVSHSIASAAWPVTALIIIVMLRKPLSGLIPLLQRLKYRDLELQFGREIQEVRQEVQAELPAGGMQAPSSTTETIAARLAEVSPRSAVLEAWRQVEDALLRAAQRRQIDVRGRLNLI